MASYYGTVGNVTEGWQVREVPEDEWVNGEPLYAVFVPRYCDCGEACCSKPIVDYSRHTSGLLFTEEDQANEWVEGVQERHEENYDAYVEENRHAIVQMERYELWRQEY